MTLLKIARMGHPILLQTAEAVSDPTSVGIERLLDDMVETMEDATGVGLAAPQVYEGQRLIIFKAPMERGNAGSVDTDFVPLTTLVNPEFDPVGDAIETGWEGCLSIPGLTGAVPRYHRIVYRGYLSSGEEVEREATNFHARVVQHEIDHLDGVLFPMRMNDLSTLSFNEELKNFMDRSVTTSEDEQDVPC
ncbi:MAG: peptide deformylase [Pseudomonadota bacterium]|nr:peptide deformylase [Pseudomonadota bacterium]